MNFIERIAVGSVFYLVGYLCKDCIHKVLSLKWNVKASLAIASLTIEILLALYNSRPSWLRNEFGQSILMFYAASIAGAAFVFLLTSLFEKIPMKIITYLSVNTLTILGIHLQLFRFLPCENAFIGAVLVLAYCLPIIWVLNRFCPTLIGNKRR